MIVKLFKKKTKSLRNINISQFIELFTDLCIEECNSKRINFQSKILDKFIAM